MRIFLIIPLCLAGCDMPSNTSETVSGSLNPPEVIDVKQEADDSALVNSELDQTGSVSARGPLGRTVASLGDAGQPGLWLKTPLVTAEGPGRVTYPLTGRSTTVTLIPIDGPATAGSRLSLQAMQALGVSLTDLPEIDVTAGV